MREFSGLKYCLHPVYLAQFLHLMIGSLLSMDGEFATLGEILYDRIGKIVILVEGKVYAEMNLVDILEGLMFDNSQWGHATNMSRERRLLTFQWWQAFTRRQRIRFGLHVQPDGLDMVELAERMCVLESCEEE